MSKQPEPTTREKLLDAASRVFVERGFRDATVAEICRRAGANIAAINYHFGGKEALYQEAWRYAFTKSIETHPHDGGVSPDAPPEERLRGHIEALIRRIADEDSRDFFIAHMEIVNPTGLLNEIMESALIPLRDHTRSLMRELLGPQAREQQVVKCELSLISLCFHPLLMQRIFSRTAPQQAPLITDIDAFIDHVINFSLAGIAAVKSTPDPQNP
ncbi:MAG: DUF1956 domain-containing protein [Desulfuromonas sp.]|nr:MAG: DUF1956 domain-containing protein [Desulfuromonas sp.]